MSASGLEAGDATVGQRGRAVTVLAETDPYKVRNGGTLRTRFLLDALAGMGARVELLIPQTGGDRLSSDGVANPGTAQRVLAAVGRAKRHLLPMPTAIGARDSRLFDAVGASSPDLFLVSNLAQVQYAARTAAPLWLDLMDLWSDFGLREAQTRRGIARLTGTLQARLLARRERSAGERAALVTATGWEDHLRLQEMGVQSEWLPTALPDVEFRAVPLRAGVDKVAGMIADFSYAPNVDAYATLVRDWLPALRRRGWTVVVAGRHSGDLTGTAGIRILGEVDDVDDFYAEVTATLAPIDRGGGMKVKVLESLARGRPVVGTPFAFAGFPPDVAGLTRLEELRSPCLAGLDDLPLVVPDDPRLAPFRQSNSANRLAEWLDRLR